MTLAYAKHAGKPVYWHKCLDKHQGQLINRAELRNHLMDIHSSMTSQRLGKIPLVLGMPIIINQNFDVDTGIVNGCVGTLKSVHFIKGVNGEHHAISCIVKTLSTSPDPLPHLASHESAILQDTVDISFVNPFSSKKCQIKRTQLPITPGFTMTTHKAQGQTLQQVIVDLEGCTGTEAPYVILSRVTSLEGLLVLWPFAQKKISCHRSKDRHIKDKQQQVLTLQTIVETSTIDKEKTSAQLQMCLGTADVRMLAYHDFTIIDGGLHAHGQAPSPPNIACQVDHIQSETERGDFAIHL